MHTSYYNLSNVCLSGCSVTFGEKDLSFCFDYVLCNVITYVMADQLGSDTVFYNSSAFGSLCRVANIALERGDGGMDAYHCYPHFAP